MLIYELNTIQRRPALLWWLMEQLAENPILHSRNWPGLAHWGLGMSCYVYSEMFFRHEHFYCLLIRANLLQVFFFFSSSSPSIFSSTVPQISFAWNILPGPKELLIYNQGWIEIWRQRWFVIFQENVACFLSPKMWG